MKADAEFLELACKEHDVLRTLLAVNGCSVVRIREEFYDRLVVSYELMTKALQEVEEIE